MNGLLFFFTTQLSAQHSPVFPQPSKVEKTTDKFVFNGRLTLDIAKIPGDLFPYIQQLFARQSIHLEPVASKDANIHLQQVETFVYTEGYQLAVTNSGIDIEYSSYQSLCNAFQTLNQLIQNSKELAGIRIAKRVSPAAAAV